VGADLAHYEKILATFASQFGADSISLRLFDAISPGSDAVRDFAQAYLPQIDLTGSGTRKNTKAGLKQLIAAAAVTETCRTKLGAGFFLPQRSAMRISEFFRERPQEIYQYSVISYAQAVAIFSRYRQANEWLFAHVPPANGEGFPDPQPEEFAEYVDLTARPLDILDAEEQEFVDRLARAIVRTLRTDA
jgi:hypothetical protein